MDVYLYGGNELGLLLWFGDVQTVRDGLRKQIDAWAENAAVFTEARAVAPWTLPSTRTMFTGTTLGSPTNLSLPSYLSVFRVLTRSVAT